MTIAAAELPPHAYIPGQTPRHPEGAFYELRSSARPNMSVSELAESAAFNAGLLFMENRYYWEAHEVLESVWMVCPPNSQARSLVQGLIQLANAELKIVMGRSKAVVRLCHIALGHLDGVSATKLMGLDVADVRRKIDSLLEQQKNAL